MFKQRYVACGAFLLSQISLPAHAAALMGFEDSAMLMTEIGRYNQEWMLNYSPTFGHAIGVEQMRMSGKGEQATTISGINYTGIIKRWNLPSAQANVWFNGSVGEASGHYDGFAYTPSLQFDVESTRLYFLAKARMIRAPHMNYDTAAVQAGFSFYETGFNETQPWFVMEVKTMRNNDPSVQVTPALRLINKNYFLEFGVTNPWQGEGFAPRLNAMFVF
ncbi:MULTISPECIES: hypothetical protein [unclassified Methylophilus]|jgi:hypothetical protein|uniref:hypothetical protein n=1 Tax=unclassified Methylophilus TaxID=2630143 RepID=UPI001890A230|nr:MULTISPECIES: hypothetical protein [unclassified Methylophilus]MBF5038312.1 hypothetical protein [Methylophilus sp. 13]MDF0378479.1 hypothetical protein [Methylophilus sp. YYY-1]